MARFHYRLIIPNLKFDRRFTSVNAILNFLFATELIKLDERKGIIDHFHIEPFEKRKLIPYVDEKKGIRIETIVIEFGGKL